MEPTDRLPEERIGPLAMIRKRAGEIEALAEACDAEADEQAQSVDRLRARASGLRHIAESYLLAAHAIDGPGLTGALIVEADEPIPRAARHTDVVFVRDPVDPSTYRLHRWDIDANQWRRSRL